MNVAPAPPLDAIYIAASAHDGRYTRICIASIRRFYPDAPIKLLPGGTLEPGLAEEAARYWNVGMADVPAGDWGWGFVKLLPLFGRPGERFMVVDSDTAFAGTVLEQRPDALADFVVDDEQQSEADTHRLYYDWKKVALSDPQARPPAFVFNSGQWFGVAGLVDRTDFGAVVDWAPMPPGLKLAGCFMPGDQGVLNYVLNQKSALDGLRVAPRKIMHWPGHGMAGFTAQTVASGAAPPVVIHWAGMKKHRLGAMAGADILFAFERDYYARVPGGEGLRLKRALGYWAGGHYKALARRVAARLKR